MKKWEYQWLDPSQIPSPMFDDLGEKGWELVGFDAKGNAWFKRAWGAE